MNIYELYGRQAEQLAHLQEYYQATQQGLRDLRDGKFLAAQLVVTDNGWEIKEQQHGLDEAKNGRAESLSRTAAAEG